MFSFGWLIRYFSSNSVEILFSVALITLVYSIARLLKVRPPIALASAFTPLLMVWAYQNALMQNLFFGII
jgi:hypothetical protein